MHGHFATEILVSMGFVSQSETRGRGLPPTFAFIINYPIAMAVSAVIQPFDS